jgi:hypothetical protein
MPDNNLEKMFFSFYSDILEEETTETVWAEVVDIEKGYYKIETIPFYIPKVASGDIVWATHSEKEGMLAYRKTIQYSGNSTIHAIKMDNEYDLAVLRQIFKEMGCRTDKLNHRYFALDVAADTDYLPIKRKLDDLEKEGIIGYAESCLSDKHQYKAFFL